MEEDLRHIKMCPECRSEYQLHIEVCIDCDTPLGPWMPPAPPPELPSIDELVNVSTGDPWQLDLRARHLASEGIANCIETDPPGEALKGSGSLLGGGARASLALYVAPGDVDEAARLLRELAESRAPGLAEAHAQLGSELEACPACGTAAVADASECHDCGLAFPSE